MTINHNVILDLIIQRWTEDMYEKENKDYGYQIRTRQYSNNNLRNDGIEQEPKYEARARVGLPYNNQKPDFIESSKRPDGQQWSDKNGLNGQRAKDYARQVPYQHHNSGKSSEEGSVTMYNRRQGSKKQQLEMRMNNINCIHDQIYSLLNMVKKERVYQSRQKITDDRPPRYVEQRSRSPINQNTVFQSYEERQEQAEPKEYIKQQLGYAKANNKSLQRLRTLSTLEPNLNGKQAKSKQKTTYHQFQYNNEQDTEARERNKQLDSPYQVSRFGSKQFFRYDPNGQKTFQAPENNRNVGAYNKYSPTNSQKARSNGSVTYKTPSKYEKIDSIKDYSYNSGNRFDEVQNPSMSNFSSNYLPITLIKNENTYVDKNEQRQQSYSGLKMIENQIKRIKEMKGQVVSPHNNTKQRFQFTSPKRQETIPNSRGKEPNRGNGFELKVFPVKNDRPETIKIAEKLCFQIEIDNRMKKTKDAFFKIEGEQKWKDLSDKLTKSGIRMSATELKDYIIPPEGYFQVRLDEAWAKKVEAFAHQFADAQRFWEKHVIGCANLKNLRNEGFDARSLDTNGKGCLKIEDIVNFVNTYTAHCYKSNDLGTVFRRLQLLDNGSNPERIEFATFMQVFTM